MKVTWLGQAGLLFQTESTTILVDPYFSDSAASVACHRKMPVDPLVWEIKPDLCLFTHDHIDHFDPETAGHFVNKNTAVTVLSPASVWEKIRTYGGENNYVRVAPGVIWSHGDVEIRFVPAVHSDPLAVGFVIQHQGKLYYITGDTLYSIDVACEIPYPVDVVFLPINGKGNNMNAVDAAKFASEIGAKLAVPVHFGMLDDIDPCCFTYEKVKIPELYKEMLL